MKDDYNDLARKLKAIADTAEGPVKTAAEYQLKKLIKKYGVKVDDIETDAISFHVFKLVPSCERLFSQVVISCMGWDTEVWLIKGTKQKKGVNCTKSQALEIEFKYQFYSKLYIEELKLFYKAFLHKHRLFAPDSPKDTPQEANATPPTDIKRMARLMDGMQELEYAKALNQEDGTLPAV